MSHIWPTRTYETTTTTGTGDYALAGAVATNRAFSESMADGDTVDACVVLGADYEYGRFTFNAGVLERTTILGSSNGGEAVDWPAGTKKIFSIHIGVTDLDEDGLAFLSALFNAVGISGTPVAGDYARFTSDGVVEGRSASEARGDLAVAAKAQVDDWAGVIRGTIADGVYPIHLGPARAGTITRVAVKLGSGTCTCTWSIDGTPLGGDPNDATTTKSSEVQATDNAYSIDSVVTLEISDASGAVDLEFTIWRSESLA